MEAKRSFQDKMYLLAVVTALVSFLFPATSVCVGGDISTQYFLTSYPGWVVFTLLLLYVTIQGFFYYKIGKWNPWIAAVLGIYLAGFAIMQMVNSWLAIDPAAYNSFVQLNGVMVKVRFAPWLMALAGMTIVIVATVKIFLRQRQ